MYQSICVPLQQSVQGKKTETVATELAKVFNGKVVGLQLQEQDRQRRRLEKMAALLPKGAQLLAEIDTDTLQAPPSPATTLDVALQDGSGLEALRTAFAGGNYELVVIPAHRAGESSNASIGPYAERMIRRSHVDTYVVKDESLEGLNGDGHILVAMDGSQEAYASLVTAIELAKRLGKAVECVAVYDPYIHYTLFNGIVNVLSAEAARVFKFADQEKLHEEIIDTGLAKIYQAHLEVAVKVADDLGFKIKATLLDGKAFQKILRHVNRTNPWLLVMGRIGVHSDHSMDVGATCENLLRTVPCDTLIISERYQPPVDVQAEASVQWTPSAKDKMKRVPDFVVGVATTAIIRWAMERGHSVITPSVINAAMGDLLPASAAQAMGYVAEELAIQADNLLEGTTFICPNCGYAARDFRPTACSVCKTEGERFEKIDREIIESAGKLDPGAIAEETFDGKRLTWEKTAKEVLRRVPSGYERRRAKARMEKTARVRGFEVVTKDFAVDMVEQEMAENAYLTKKGEHLEIAVHEEEKPDDAVAREREASPLLWTDAAWTRISRVPFGFMRDMTRDKVEQYAASVATQEVDMEICLQGILEGRRVMAEMLGDYASPAPAAEAKPETVAEPTCPVDHEKKEAQAACPVEHVAEKAAAEGTAGKCPVDHEAMAQAQPEQATGQCPFDHEAMEKPQAEPEAQPEAAKCPVDHAAMSQSPEWTPAAEAKAEAAASAASEAGKFDANRAMDLTKNVTEERARNARLQEIGESFMMKLGSQLGYGHPLSEKTTEYHFEWTPEAEARLSEVPDFCREMTRWRVEWTAVKKELGFVITPEIMDVKFEAWGEVSTDIMERGDSKLEWDPDAMARLERIPDFVKGQVIQSVEGNAKDWEITRVTNQILDRVIDKWIDTGDFHEGAFGYK
jgi:nucleotide-binding universal stress UspA family protein